MIRPSMMSIAEKCGLAPVLAERYPESSLAAERGTLIHAQAAGKCPATSPEAKAAIAWVNAKEADGWRVHQEVAVRLEDPETGALITEGTADIVLVNETSAEVWDLKTGRPEFVAEPDDNLQILTYGVGAAMKYGVESFRAGLIFLDGDAMDIRVSRDYPDAAWWPLIDRIKAVTTKAPFPVFGPHCSGCYQRRHCPSWTLPAHEGASVLEPFKRPADLTAERAARGLLAIQSMREACDVAEEHLKDFVKQGGTVEQDGKLWGPTTVAGRETVDARAVKAAGLTQFVKQGAPYQRWGWRKAS